MTPSDPVATTLMRLSSVSKTYDTGEVPFIPAFNASQVSVRDAISYE